MSGTHPSFFGFEHQEGADEVDLDMDAVRQNYRMRREDTYIARAIDRIVTATIMGGLEVKLGGVIPIAAFSRRMERAWVENARYALEWFMAAGFVPLEITNPLSTADDQGSRNEDASQSGQDADPGVGADPDKEVSDDGQHNESARDADQAGDVLGPSDIEMEYRVRHQHADTVPEDLADPANPLDTTMASLFGADGDVDNVSGPGVRTDDFSFAVPTVGYGQYRVYRDVNDNRRKVYKVYNEQDRESARMRIKKRRQRSDSSASNSMTRAQPELDADEDLYESETRWYVFMLEEPRHDGLPSCPLSRIIPHYERYIFALNQERGGVHLANNPLSFVQHQPPGKYLGNLDRHSSYMTEEESVRIHTEKSQRGRPRQIEEALQNAHRHFRNVIGHAGLDLDEMEQSYMTQLRNGNRNGDDASREGSGRTQLLPEMRTYAGTVKPTKYVVASEYREMYINAIVVEFGIPAQDFATQDHSRFKHDRNQQVPALIERVRDFRTNLSEMMQEIFMKKNANNLSDTLARIAETVEVERVTMYDAVKRLSHMSKNVRKRLFKGSVVNPPHEQSQTQPQTAPADSQPSDDAAAVDQSSQKVYEAPMDSEVKEALEWIRYIENTYEAVSQAQSFINRVLSNDSPLVVSWRQPIVPDANTIATVADLLGWDDQRRQQLTAHYLGASS